MDQGSGTGAMVKTVIVGGGLMGLATAQALVERGEQVTVVEARDDVALETSFGNAGMMTPSMGDPWNGPGVHRHLAASLFNPLSPMKLRLRALPSLTTWGIRFLRNSARDRHLAATEANFRLGSYSVEETRGLRERLGLAYDAADRGTILAAYRRLAQRLGYSNVEIAALRREAGCPMEPLKLFLLEESRRGRAVLSLGDWSVSSEETRGGAVELFGRPHLLVRLDSE